MQKNVPGHHVHAHVTHLVRTASETSKARDYFRVILRLAPNENYPTASNNRYSNIDNINLGFHYQFFSGMSKLVMRLREEVFIRPTFKGSINHTILDHHCFTVGATFPTATTCTLMLPS